jgi:hypothetical protein
MEFKGTKGKWFIDNEESHIMTNGIYCNVISTEKTISLADVYGDDEEAQANALLISKSLKMLDFINRISAEMLRNDFVLDEKWYVQAEQLIKEATEI